MFRLSERTDIVEVSKSSSEAFYPFHYHIWVASSHRLYDVTRDEFASLLRHHIPNLLPREQDRKLSVDDLARFDFT